MLRNKQQTMTGVLHAMFDLSPPVPGDVLLTPDEVATITRLSVRTLADKRWRKTGPPYVKLSPARSGSVRYWRSSVTNWLARGTVHTAS
jgi:predicted DNA-binding transcriptional regulator AlpA